MLNDDRLRVYGPDRWRIPVGWTASPTRLPVPCKACHASILFMTSDKSGKAAPFDPIADDAGANAVSVTHFATCPDAKRFRHARR